MNLYSIAEQVFRQVFPDPSDESKLRKGDFIAAAKTEYATILWIHSKQEKREEGFWEPPSFLLSEHDFDVFENTIDISGIKALTILPNDDWIRQMGTFECPYVRSSVSRSLALRDDDSLGNKKTYFRIGNKIAFPRGVYGNTVKMIYANNGDTIPNNYEIDDLLGGTLRNRLLEMFLGKVGVADVTNNTNPER